MVNLLTHCFFKKNGITTLFEVVGLVKMLSPSPLAYPVLIKQFYKNMFVKSDTIETLVQDKVIFMDVKLLDTLFNIPHTGIFPFTLKGLFKLDNLKIIDLLRIVKECETSELFFLPKVVETTPINSVIHKLIRSNLIPRTGGHSDMT